MNNNIHDTSSETDATNRNVQLYSDFGIFWNVDTYGQMAYTSH